jgi:hypothetical protein
MQRTIERYKTSTKDNIRSQTVQQDIEVYRSLLIGILILSHLVTKIKYGNTYLVL